jgi:hypothetical protein
VFAKKGPELNDIEIGRGDLKAIIWPTRRSPILTSLDWAIVAALNSKQKRHRLGNQSLLRCKPTYSYDKTTSRAASPTDPKATGRRDEN